MTRAVLLITLAASFAQAHAGIPEWAQPFVASAPEVAGVVSKHPSRVLFAETALQVADDGRFTVRRRVVVQAQSARAEEVGLGSFSFTDGARILSSRAWHLAPDSERARRSRDGGIDFTIDSSFLTDARVRVVPVEGVRKGSLVFFEFTATENYPVLTYRSLFLEGGPIDVARFSVELPAGWSLRSDWPRGGGIPPTVAGSTTTWELRNLPYPEDEPLGIGPVESAPLLVIGIDPSAGYTGQRRAVADWGTYGRWYEQLLGDRAAPTPEIAATAVALPGADDPLELTRAAVLHVRDNVRYVAKSIGIGSLQPRRADEVLHGLWGDCKDKGTLLRALLAAHELPAYPVLVNASLRDTVSNDVPDVGAFDHFVLAVTLPADLEIPDSMTTAVLEVESLGRLLIVDPTDEYMAPGGISAALAGKRALVVAGDQSRLVTLPTGSPEAHRVDRELEIDVRPDDTLSLQLVSRFHGEAAIGPLAALRASQRDRRREAEAEIARVWIGATIEDWTADVAAREAPFVETLRWTAPLNDAELVLFPGALETLPRVSVTRRKTPVVLRHPFSVSYRTRVRGANSGVYPTASERSGDGWTVRTGFKDEAGALAATLEVRLERLEFDTAELPELRAFWMAADRGGGVALPLSP